MRSDSDVRQLDLLAGRCGVGLGDEEARVDAYNPDWAMLFGYIERALSPVFGHARVEHVGSTAVPGCSAKPLIDVSVGLEPDQSLDVADAEACGLTFRSVNPQSVLFAIYASTGERIANVHVRYRGSPYERWDILWRDFLRANPSEVASYGHEKLNLERVATSREGYTASKGPYISEAHERAEAWAQRTNWQLAP